MLILIFLFGLIAGSFVSAISYRLTRGINFWSDRSRCPKCKNVIAWYDNIPLLSYLFLGGKCRKCGKYISIRYPLTELSTGLVYLGILGRFGDLGLMYTTYYILLSTILIAIFVIDLELQIIPDELVFVGIFLAIPYLILGNPEILYQSLLSGFAASIFLLIINFATLGRGMGLGDVKFAILGGLILGYPNTITWLFLSFLMGAVIGIFLLAFGKAKLGKKIAFGPFLVASLFITLLWGDKITHILLPYL